MKKQINILAVCLMAAGLTLAPRVAHAQIGTPPCSVANLVGGFGYSLSGAFFGTTTKIVQEDGEIVFDGAGHFTRTFTQVDSSTPVHRTTRWNVSQGNYTVDPGCIVVELIAHGSVADMGDLTVPCVHFQVIFAPLPVRAASPIVLPPAQELLTPPPSKTLFADAILACTDSTALELLSLPIPPFAKGLEGLFDQFTSTYAGPMAAN